MLAVQIDDAMDGALSEEQKAQDEVNATLRSLTALWSSQSKIPSLATVWLPVAVMIVIRFKSNTSDLLAVLRALEQRLAWAYIPHKTADGKDENPKTIYADSLEVAHKAERELNKRNITELSKNKDVCTQIDTTQGDAALRNKVINILGASKAQRLRLFEAIKCTTYDPKNVYRIR